MRATRALVRLDFLRDNIRLIREHTGGTRKICLAVKADAYGHGIVPVGLVAASYGVDYLAVATADEGIELREAGSRLPILLYSLATPEEMPLVVANDITPILSDEEQVRQYADEATRAGVRLTVHIKVDTGMGRIGCRPELAPELALAVSRTGSLVLGGVSTHFAAADSEDERYTKEQITRFEAALERIRDSGVDPGIVHAANSGGVLAHPESWYDMVRPGILAYGYYPSDEQARVLPLRPVMQFASRVVYLKQVAPGDAISYGMTWRAPRETWIGTVPAGYGDGYNRLLSNRADVLIRGRRYPVVGRVCMDQLMVDLGPHPDVKRYDEAVLFGYEEGAPTAAELAKLCQTIPYEITCALSRRVPRIYAGDDASA